MVYTIPYIFLIAFYGGMAWLYNYTTANRNRLVVIAACFFVTLFFWGFRGYCFHDWTVYYVIFQKLETSSLHLALSNSGSEPGFTTLMFLCKNITNNYIFFNVACSLINLLLLSRFLLKHTENYAFSLMICTVFGGIMLFTDLMRNAIAIFLFINAIDYIRERNPLKYFAVCLLSLSFHYSAIFYFPLYFFLHKKINKNIFLAIFIISCCIYILQVPLFLSAAQFILSIVSPDMLDRIGFYLEEIAKGGAVINFVFVERIFTAIIIYCYMDKLRTIREDANIYINCVLLFFAFNFLLYEFPTLSERLSFLFTVGYWVVWNDLTKCFSIENNRKLYILIVCVYCLLRIIGNTKNNIIARYDNVLFDSETYQERQSVFRKNYKGD